MICMKCGKKYDDDSVFCIECGSPLQKETPVEDKKPEPVVQPQGRPMNQGQPVPPQGRPMNQGQPVPPQGRPMNQGQPVKPKKPKKPISKLVYVVAGEAVAAIALLAGTFAILSNRFSPDTVAENYWTAVAERDWSQAYEYCEFPENQLLSKEMYVTVNADNTEPLNYKSLKIRDSKEVAEDALNDFSSLFGVDTDAYGDYADETESDVKSYTVEYMVKGADSKSYEYLSLTKTGEKKLLFWDEWKVVSSNSFVEDFTISIPKDATLTMNGVKVDDKIATVEGDAWKTFYMPYLFAGDYQIEVSQEGMKTLYWYGDIYYDEESYTWSLLPDEATMKELGQQAGQDIQTLLESALNGESFGSIQEMFLTSAVNNNSIKEEYEDLVDEICANGGDTQIISLYITDFKSTLDDVSYDNEVCLKVTANWDETYAGYYRDQHVKGKATIYMYYVKDGDVWKLTNLPIDAYDF